MKITINLLPLKQKNSLRSKYIFRTLLEQQFLIVTLLLLVGLGLFTINYLLRVERDSLMEINEGLVERPDYKEILELHETFAKTNDQVEVVSSLQQEHIQWTDILTLLSNNIPTDISVRQLSTVDNVVTLRGVAARVDSLVGFQESLSAIQMDQKECFMNVDVPDQYLVKSEDVDFIMTFQLNVNDCMKENYE